MSQANVVTLVISRGEISPSVLLHREALYLNMRARKRVPFGLLQFSNDGGMREVWYRS